MTGRKLLFARLVCVGVAVALSGPLSGVGVLSAASAVNDQQPPAPGRGSAPGPGSLGWEWWNDADIQRELALSADKVKRINDLYERRNQELRSVIHEYQKQQGELDKMTRQRVVDESTYQLQVMRMEAARARLNESRLVMLYRFYRELTPEQHQKLQDILDRRFNRGGRGGRPTPDAR